MKRFFAWATLVVCLGSTTAEAQTMQRPSRPYRGLFGGGPPPDPSRNRQELTLNASMLGGYDEYLGSEGPTGPNATVRDTYSGFFETGLGYFAGKETRSLSATATAFSNAYSAG